METLSNLLKERNVDDIKKFDEGAPLYLNALPRFSYLENLSESGIFEAYYSALLHDTELSFPDSLRSED
jgi:hypothetical protein